jgi:hypothetical protein
MSNRVVGMIFAFILLPIQTRKYTNIYERKGTSDENDENLSDTDTK